MMVKKKTKDENIMEMNAGAFRAMIERGKDVIVLINADGSIRYRSPSYKSVFGHDPATMEDVPFLENIHPDDLGPLKALLAKVMVSPGQSFDHQWRKQHTDGSCLWIEGTATNHLDEPDIQAIICNCRNITEKKKAEEAVLINKRRFKALIENSKDVVALTDANKIITYISPAVREILGYSPDELIGKTSYNVLMNPAEMDENIAFRMSIAPGQTVSRLTQIRHKDGSWRWLEADVTNYLDDPAVKGMLTNFRDVTEKKIATEALVDSERKFRALIENNRDGIALTDHNREIVYVSPSMTNILGYTTTELLGRRAADLYHPDDLIEMEKRVSSFLINKEGYISGLARMRHKDGNWRWIELTASNKLDDPAINAIVTNFRDITDKKEAEEERINSEKKFQALIENGKDGIALTGADRLFTYISPQVKNILGYEPNELMGTHPLDMYHPDDHTRIFSFVESIKDKNVPHTINDLRILRKDGRWIWADLTFCDQFDDPAVNAMVCNFRDVTERKEAKDQLDLLNHSLEKKVEERTEQLQESNKALESFSYMAAHDLQAPLRILSGYASILKKDYDKSLNDDGRNLLDTMVLKTRYMSKLISDMLTFSRASHAVMKEEKVDFNEMVNGLTDQLSAAQNNAEIKRHDLGYRCCDAGLMQQVWMNLISNALKYSSKKEKPVIEIGSKHAEGETIYYVKDNGAGFDMKYATNLFEVFTRMHTAVEFEGTGIGLALVKSIIIRHGGRVWAEAEVGKGATFYFSMPDVAASASV